MQYQSFFSVKEINVCHLKKQRRLRLFSIRHSWLGITINNIERVSIMNIIKAMMITAFVTLCLGTTSRIAYAVATGMDQPINNTVNFLESALHAIEAEDFEGAQEFMKAARQSAKKIIGGTLEARSQRGSDAIVNARLLAKEGNGDGAAAALKEAIKIFKSMLSSYELPSQGGLR
jgi:hypothetical protein